MQKKVTPLECAAINGLMLGKSQVTPEYIVLTRQRVFSKGLLGPPSMTNHKVSLLAYSNFSNPTQCPRQQKSPHPLRGEGFFYR